MHSSATEDAGEARAVVSAGESLREPRVRERAREALLLMGFSVCFSVAVAAALLLLAGLGR